MIEAIYTRRSIRYFKDEPLPEEALAEILRAGMQAPSPKNRQPWRFLVISGASKEAMLAAMEKGIERSAAGEGLLTPLPGYIENARFTLRAMGEAPVTVIAVNPLGRSPLAEWTAEDKINELSNVQAVGAAAENMALAAADLGIGSLWNGNIFFAYEELSAWLDEPGEWCSPCPSATPPAQASGPSRVKAGRCHRVPVVRRAVKVIVSACLLGRRCKYDGGHNKTAPFSAFSKGKKSSPSARRVSSCRRPVPRRRSGKGGSSQRPAKTAPPFSQKASGGHWRSSKGKSPIWPC